MKAIQLFMLGLLAVSATAGATEKTDSVTIITSPTIITIKNTDSGSTITVTGCKENPNFRFKSESTSVSSSDGLEAESLWAFNERFTNRPKKKKRNPSADGFCDFYAGAIIPSDADAGISRAGWEIGMLNVAKLQWRLSNCGTEISLGIGWDYRHFTIGDGLRAYRGSNGSYDLSPIPDDDYNSKSTLRNFAVQFPLALRQKISGKFTLEVGGIAMINAYTTGNSSWRTDDTSSKLHIKNLHQRILTADILARIGWRNTFAFYFRYSPIPQFKNGFGPQYKSFSVGASLGF